MRVFTIAITVPVFVGMTVLALANPVMLPEHPGYPSHGEFANDTGRQNLTYNQSIQDAAKSGDMTMSTTPGDSHDGGQREPQGPSQLPTVQGTNIKTEPPLKESTWMPTK